VGVFRDFLPSQQVCKSFFHSAPGFSPAQGVFRCHFLQFLVCRLYAANAKSTRHFIGEFFHTNRTGTGGRVAGSNCTV
jgi:hypothetical protein